jgi:hypothetical protein
MSVILTSQLNGSAPIPGMTDPRTGEPVTEAGAAIANQHGAGIPLPPEVFARGLAFVADSFATTFWVGFALVLLTFIPIAFLPRRRAVSRLGDGVTDLSGGDKPSPAPTMVH